MRVFTLSLGKLCRKRFRYFPLSKAPADIALTIFISLPRMWFYAAASMEIQHSVTLTSQTRHNRFDGVWEIPFNDFAA